MLAAARCLATPVSRLIEGTIGEWQNVRSQNLEEIEILMFVGLLLLDEFWIQGVRHSTLFTRPTH